MHIWIHVTNGQIFKNCDKYAICNIEDLSCLHSSTGSLSSDQPTRPFPLQLWSGPDELSGVRVSRLP